ncbi:Cytochrome c551 peroxidase precursor [Planctomycetes bacterium Pan216]|uniref:Cytochrome c551 peroxidase n=1 Tax=Kolteria novifilia TaxID=2527975 RepID=A0A518B2X2_9BACT|nr:Cytochrome c551 peroxidase precursor [Planctomycetes bacterium Pan216]
MTSSRRSPSIRRPRRKSRRLLRIGAGIAQFVLFVAVACAMLAGPSEATLRQGEELFVHEWQPNDPLARNGDGLGPVFNAKSCVECHFQGGVGGAGPNKHNVTAYEILPTAQRPQRLSGVIHASATDVSYRETTEQLRSLFPVEPGGPIRVNCATITPDFDPLRMTEINTPPLFGLGLIDNINSFTVQGHHFSKAIKKIGSELQLEFDAVSVGTPRILDDGRFGRFGWKGQFANLEEFVAAACAMELGLSNPLKRQPVPGKPNESDTARLDMDRQQLRSLVAFVRHLPRPEQVMPEDTAERQIIERGEHLFTSIGCAQCHTPTLGGIEGLYSDLSLHRLTEPDNASYREPVPRDPIGPDRHPSADEWKTPPLWGVADSAPYFHDGGSPTLESAIHRHAGASRKVTEQYKQLEKEDRVALIKFLKSLRAPVMPAVGEGTLVLKPQ